MTVNHRRTRLDRARHGRTAANKPSIPINSGIVYAIRKVVMARRPRHGQNTCRLCPSAHVAHRGTPGQRQCPKVVVQVGATLLPTQYEAAQQALEALIMWAEDHSPEVERNEAATRLHLIDRLLI